MATGSYAAERPGFFQRFLARRLEGVETEIAYPAYRVGDVLLTHGHYLDAHIGGSFPNRLQARATRTVGGVNGDRSRLTEQDYESVIVFAHTHHALDGVERDGVRYWNTGCWIEEPGTETVGTAVLIDTDEPEPRLLRLPVKAAAAATDRPGSDRGRRAPWSGRGAAARAGGPR